MKPSAGGVFSYGEQRILFDEPSITSFLPAFNVASYRPAPDGKRFLACLSTDTKEEIHLLTNWTQIGARISSDAAAK